MFINHNLTASNVASSLNIHYAELAASTKRLSSGLRIGSSADDAAGLAIRELMRADIAALNQGARNASDAISMIQTADGALQIIDEKLIRMKELAEQAATGTYDSTQRTMIDREFQAMSSEITRIARATDFNGVKLIAKKVRYEEYSVTVNHAASVSVVGTSAGVGSISPSQISIAAIDPALFTNAAGDATEITVTVDSGYTLTSASLNGSIPNAGDYAQYWDMYSWDGSVLSDKEILDLQTRAGGTPILINYMQGTSSALWSGTPTYTGGGATVR
jgi:flagellin-like hook-associated protein FlgL